MDLSPSDKGSDTARRVRHFVDTEIRPLEEKILGFRRAQAFPFSDAPEVDALRTRAREQGLWNLFLPSESGLSVLDYAYCAEQMGRCVIGAEIFNCQAPDSGNIELLEVAGTADQKQRYMRPLLNGDIRSTFCMTEPDVASSDPTNIATRIEQDGNELVVDGRKWWATGAGHPKCEFAIVLGKSRDDTAPHEQHSMALVPLAADGVKIERMLSVFGEQDPPHGHAEITFDEVRIPVEALLGTIGSGFTNAQRRLGPGRIHHCMRLIGAAEATLELVGRRTQKRHAFGKPIAQLGGNIERIAEARLAIEQARLLTLKAAAKIDSEGAREARTEIAAIKVIAPRMAQQVIDDAIQMFGGAGVCEDWPLASFFIQARALRLADGPDEVHLAQIAKAELRRFIDD